jgi:hypothetical protein
MTGTTSRGGGSLFTEAVLVVNQKVKLMGIEYTVFNQRGQQIGVLREMRPSAAKKFVRFVPAIEGFFTRNWQVVDANDQVVLTLTRPAKIRKSPIIVESGDGRELGQIIQIKAFGKIRFALESGEGQIGSLNRESLRAWNFNVQDTSGRVVARIRSTKRCSPRPTNISCGSTSRWRSRCTAWSSRPCSSSTLPSPGLRLLQLSALRMSRMVCHRPDAAR